MWQRPPPYIYKMHIKYVSNQIKVYMIFIHEAAQYIYLVSRIVCFFFMSILLFTHVLIL